MSRRSRPAAGTKPKVVGGREQRLGVFLLKPSCLPELYTHCIPPRSRWLFLAAAACGPLPDLPGSCGFGDGNRRLCGAQPRSWRSPERQRFHIVKKPAKRLTTARNNPPPHTTHPQQNAREQGPARRLLRAAPGSVKRFALSRRAIDFSPLAHRGLARKVELDGWMSLRRGGCGKDFSTLPTGSQVISHPLCPSPCRCGNAGKAQRCGAEDALLAQAAASLGWEPFTWARVPPGK